MVFPSGGRASESVALLGGKPYMLVTEEQAKLIDGVKRAWDVRRVTRQSGDPEPEFEVALETYGLGYGISYAVLPGGYERANGWDASAPGKLASWPRLSVGEAFTTNENIRSWEYYNFASGYYYLFRGGYALKYEIDPTPDAVWPILEIHYFGADRVVSGKWAEFDGNLYVPLIDPTTDAEQRFERLDTISTTTTEVQLLTETGSPTGGTFTVSFADGITTTVTSALAFNITAAAMQTALRLIPGLQRVTVARSGATTNFVWTVTMTAAPSVISTTSPPQFTVTTALTGGTAPTVTPTTSIAGIGDEWDLGPALILSRYFTTWEKPGVGPTLNLIVSNTVRTVAADPMTALNWSSAYSVGNSTYRCTALTVWDSYLMVGKQDGLYSFDEQAVARLETKDLAGVIDDANFVGMVEAGGYLLCPHKNGLLRWRPGAYRFIGAEQEGLFEGENSSGWGPTVGVTPFGKYTYITVTDSVNEDGIISSLVAPGSQVRGPLTPHMHHQFDGSAEDIITTTLQSNPPRPADVSTGTDNSAVGAVAWTNPGNIAIASAEVTAVGPGVTHYEQALMPAITRVPVGATINGIQVDVDRKLTLVTTNSGALSPGVGANFAAIGTNAWTNPGNITATDNLYATCAIAGSTQGLRGSTYGAAVPSGATILGITAAVERSCINGYADANSGPNYATSVTNNAAVGSLAWSNFASAQGVPGSDAASVTLPNGGTSYYLSASNFAFSIGGSGHTILGVTVRIKKSYDGATAGGDFSVRLLKGNSPTGSDKAVGGNWPFGSASNTTYVSYGGAADMWGATLTEADIEASGFGVAISCISNGGTNAFYVSGFEITVTYEGAAGIVDSVVRLVDASSAAVGTNKAAAGDWPTSDAVATYGGAADLWGAAWTPADVNSVNFGLAVAAVVPSSGTAKVDHITITITYQVGDIVDNVVRLVVASAVAGTDLADTTTAWPTLRTTKTYGGPTNMWGLTPSVAQVNAATFGFVLSANITGGNATLYGIATVTVYYTAGNGVAGSVLVAVQVDADGVTATPFAYELPRAGMPVANDPGVGKAVSDKTFHSSRIMAPSRNTQKTYRSVEFYAGLSPEVNTPGLQMWASVDDGAFFALLDAAGATLTCDASDAYEAFFPDTVSAVGRWVQLRPTVPALAGGEVGVAVTLRDVTLHGSWSPKTTDYVTAVFILKDNPGLADGTTDRRTAKQQREDLVALYGPRPDGVAGIPIALHDPETGEDTTCVITGEPKMQRIRFQNATDPEWVAVVTLRKTPRGA